MIEDVYVTKMLRNYRSAGLDDELIAIAEKDMRDGKDQRIIDCYTNTKLDKTQMFQLAKALHEGMPLELAEKILTLDKYQIAEVLDRVAERMPYPFIMAVLEKNPSGKHLQFGFEKAKEIILNRLHDELSEEIEESLKDVADKTDTTKENDPKESSDTGSSEKEDKPVKEEKNKDEFVDETPEPAESKTNPNSDVKPERIDEETLKQFGDIFTKSVHDILENNTAMMERMIAASDERTQKILDKVIESNRTVYVPAAIPDKSVDEVKTGPIEEKEAKKVDAPFPEYDEKQAEKTLGRIYSYSEKIKESVPDDTDEKMEKNVIYAKAEPEHKKPVRKMPAEVDGVMRMMYMPDGTIYPVFIEKQIPDKRKGVLGMASKFFAKDSKQNALLSMLIEGRLNNDQIEQIHRAVVLGFGDNDIRDLIYSDLSADEMKGIVTVIDADMHRKK